MRSQTVLLGVIAVLAVVAVYFGAKATRSRNSLREVVRRHGPGGGRRAAAPRARPLPARPAAAEPSLAAARAAADALVAAGGVPVGDEYSRHLAIIAADVAGSVAAHRGAGGETPAPDVSEIALCAEYLGGAVGKQGAMSPALIAEAMHCVARQVDAVHARSPEFAGPDRLGVRLNSEIAVVLKAVSAYEPPRGSRVDELKALLLRRKARLYEFAAAAGWAAGGGDAAGLAEARRAGRHLGAAAQIVDDIADSGRGLNTFADRIGIEAARKDVSRNLTACALVLSQCKIDSAVWKAIIAQVEIAAQAAVRGVTLRAAQNSGNSAAPQSADGGVRAADGAGRTAEGDDGTAEPGVPPAPDNLAVN